MLYDITYMWNLENTRKNKKFKNTMNQCLKQKKAEIQTLRRNQWLWGREAIQGWGSWRYKLLGVGQAQGCTVQHGEYIQYFVIGVNRKIVSNFQNNCLKLSGKKKESLQHQKSVQKELTQQASTAYPQKGRIAK